MFIGGAPGESENSLFGVNAGTETAEPLEPKYEKFQDRMTWRITKSGDFEGMMKIMEKAIEENADEFYGEDGDFKTKFEYYKTSKNFNYQDKFIAEIVQPFWRKVQTAGSTVVKDSTFEDLMTD